MYLLPRKPNRLEEPWYIPKELNLRCIYLEFTLERARDIIGR